MKNSNFHKPALLQEALNLLEVKPGARYIDCTLGGGGHTTEILNQKGIVLAIDQDIDAISYCQSQEALKPALASKELVLVHANFSQLSSVIKDHHWAPVMGILFDLGISSHQIDTPSRGFSLNADGPLDMRMDSSSTLTASHMLNTLPAELLGQILQDLGEIPVAKQLALKIVAARPLTTTMQLSNLLGKWSRQAFQAVRIAVNDELGVLTTLLTDIPDLLAANGTVVAISFHSLEDRIVKDQFRLWEQQKIGTVLTKKPLIPGPQELSENPRVHSAKLRAFRKI